MALFTSFWLYDLIFTALAALAALYLSFKIKYRYWTKRGIPIPGPAAFPLGHFQGVSTKKSILLLLSNLYLKMKDEKYFGCYLLSRRVFIPRDLELIKTILVNDFSSFHDRGFVANTEREPLAGHLFLMNGQEWRNLRIKLTPTFTTGKMRMMFPTLIDIGKHLEDVIDDATNEPEVEVKDILSRYTMDVISSCVFGIENNLLKDPSNEFRTRGLELVHPKWDQVLKNLLVVVAPKASRFLPIYIIPQHLTAFFLGVVRDTIEYRTANDVKRNDFMQLLIQLKNLGYIPDADHPVGAEEANNAQKFTIEQAAAQAFLFFFAGFETSSSTMQFALYELALNPELQSRLQEEIDDVKEKNENKITYDAMQEMKLLDRVVAETLRKYPVAGILIRESNVDYTIPGTNQVLERNTTVMIPVHGIHYDPDYYPDPEKFDPDRFLPEEKERRPHYAYLPFGEGPRVCIGNRFALMQVKAGLCLILSKFTVSPSSKTPIPMEFDPKMDLLTPKGGMHLKISKRKL